MTGNDGSESDNLPDMNMDLFLVDPYTLPDLACAELNFDMGDCEGGEEIPPPEDRSEEESLYGSSDDHEKRIVCPHLLKVYISSNKSLLSPSSTSLLLRLCVQCISVNRPWKK